MMATGKFQNSSELRKKPRRQFHYQAAVLTDDQKQIMLCNIHDISDSGARIVLEKESELPPVFLLLLSRNGRTYRKARLVWQNGTTVGVRFLDRK